MISNSGWNYKGKTVQQDIDDRMCSSCWAGRIDQVEKYIKEGANVHARDGAAMKHARDMGHTHIVKYLENVIYNLLKEKRLKCLKKI